MAGKFEVYKDKAGKYRFRLKASNGEIAATGEAYESIANAKAGCESVQGTLPTRPSSRSDRRSASDRCTVKGSGRPPAPLARLG